MPRATPGAAFAVFRSAVAPVLIPLPRPEVIDQQLGGVIQLIGIVLQEPGKPVFRDVLAEGFKLGFDSVQTLQALDFFLDFFLDIFLLAHRIPPTSVPLLTASTATALATSDNF